MAQPDSSMFDFGLADPDQVQDQVDQNYQAGQRATGGNLGSTMAAQAGNSVNMGLQSAVGNPQVRQAKAMQQRMTEILESSNQGAPKDEDPIDKQMRVNSAVQLGMADINPRASMAAGQNLIQLAQAKQQQSLLNIKTQEATAQLSTAQDDAMKARYSAGLVVTDAGADPMNPSKSPQIPINMYNDDGTKKSGVEIAQQIAAANKQLKDQGLQPTITTEDKLNDNRIKVAQLKAQSASQVEMMKAYALANKPTAVPMAQKNDFVKENVSTIDYSTRANQFADFLTQPGNASANTVGAHLSTTLSNWAQQGASLLSTDQSTQDAVSALDRDPQALKNPQYKTMVLGLAWAYTRSGIGGSNRMTNTEIGMAKEALGNNPNAATTLAALKQITDQKIQSWSQRLNAAPGLADDPNYATAHQSTLDSLKATSGKIDAAMDKLGYKQTASGGAGPTKDMPNAVKLKAYADAHFNGDGAKAMEYLQSQGYK